MPNLDAVVSALLHAASDAIAITDGAWRLLHSNRAFDEYFNPEKQSAIGEQMRHCHGEEQFEELERTLLDSGQWQGLINCKQAKRAHTTIAGNIQQLEVDGSIIHLLTLKTQDPADSANSTSQLDRLTGLPNRFLLRDRLERAMVWAKRQQQSVAVITIGLDHFSRINDGLGHQFGDEVIKAIAERLNATIRRSDSVARVSGDQFVIIAQMRSSDDGVIVGEKLLKIFNEPLQLGERAITVTASLGIALYPSDTEAVDDLLERADSAMNHAKRVGGNCYQFFAGEMNEKARRRIQIENDLRRALENDEFLLFYQPKVEVGSGRIVGAEALIRWQDPERGLIPPFEFIPIAEESGLIGPIGSWVLAEAFQQTALWQRQGLPKIQVSVNVAAPQLHGPGLIEEIQALLETHQLPAHYMELEITESMLMGNVEQVTTRLKALREYGLNISIDDFGTGYSSLSYLSQFPITTLKIDRSFIQDLAINRNTAEITRAIIGLSKGLELEVVAEGVETAEHIDFLREHGCLTVQGFLYSRPLPADEFTQLLAKGHIETTAV